jgi:uncharacterized membrane protein YkvA (DUF1232 family)
MTLAEHALVALILTAAAYMTFVGVLLLMGRRSDARALAGFIPDCVVLFRRLLREDRISRRRKLLFLALLAYLAMPFDLVPDFIPVAGQLDDAIVVALALRIVLKGAGPTLVREHWPGPGTSLNHLLRLAGRASA